MAAPHRGSAVLLFRWIVRILLAAFILAGTAFVAARYHDGPLGPLPGGPLASGPLVTRGVADWSFAKDVEEIELQLDSQAKSRTVWVLVNDGKAYVPASTAYPPGKTWHLEALKDGRATLRIAGKRYPVTLAKVEDPAVLDALRAVAEKKYPSAPPGGRESVWAFSVTAR